MVELPAGLDGLPGSGALCMFGPAPLTFLCAIRQTRAGSNVCPLCFAACPLPHADPHIGRHEIVPGVRRSSRQKQEPLKWWLNEKKEFGRAHKCVGWLLRVLCCSGRCWLPIAQDSLRLDCNNLEDINPVFC